MDKQLLQSAILALAVIGVIAVGYVFVASLNPSAEAIARARYQLDLSGVKTGELKEFSVQGKPLYVYRPTAEQWKDIEFLNAHVWNPEFSGYDGAHRLFVYWGLSTRFGCGLEISPKGPSRIAEWGGEWLGGYFDPCHDSSYDYAGRTIKTYKYTHHGYDFEVPNLRAPKFEVKGNELLIKLL